MFELTRNRSLSFVIVCALCAGPRAAAQIQTGDILVTTGDQGGGRALIRVRPGTGAQSVITAGGLIGRPTAAAVRSDGMIFVVDGDRFGFNGGAPQVVRVEPDTGIQTVVAHHGLMLDLDDVEFGPDGKLYIADFSGPTGGGGIFRVDSVTGVQTVVHSAHAPFYVGMESSGAVLFGSGNAFGSPLYRLVVPPPTVLVPNTGVISGIAVASDGQIYVSDSGGFAPDGLVLGVDPVSGATHTVSSGGLLGKPFRVAVGQGDDLYVTVPSFPQFSLLRIDRVTGAQELVSSGGLLVDTHGIVVVPELTSGSLPPVFDPPTPCGETLMASAGVPFSFTVTASDPADDETVVLTASGLPAGATMTPSLPAGGNPVSSTFLWTPANDQVGVFTIAFTATDDIGHDATCEVTVMVAECHLILGVGEGDTRVTIFGHPYTTQMHWVRRSFPVTMTDMPSFPLPVANLEGHGLLGRAPMSVQVVMYNPLAFPGNPEQWSQRLSVVASRAGAVASGHSGTRNGIRIGVETFIDTEGRARMRFPFTIEGM